MKIKFHYDWKNIVFGVYLFFVLMTSAWYGSTGGANFSLWTTLILCTVFLLVPKINYSVKKVLFSRNAVCSSKNKLHIFFTTTGVAFLVSFVWFLGSFPGSFSPDSISQYSQAISGHYNDWHPVLHTLLFFRLPQRITDGWVVSIVLFQIVYFSFLMGYFSLTIYRYSSLQFMLISFVLIVFSPFTLEILMYPWKDTAFAFASCLSMIFAVQIYFTKDEWCKIWRIVLFAFVLACATLLKYVFSCIGSAILVMFAFILYKTDFTRKEDWKRIFLCLAVFTYNFGTMLLLTGPDVRFFFVTFLVWPFVVLVMSRKFEIVENSK